jgi:hypothetical protein
MIYIMHCSADSRLFEKSRDVTIQERMAEVSLDDSISGDRTEDCSLDEGNTSTP